jgi:dipeptidyl aminopeptidase/acylaminoacyl peptidase
MMGRASDTLSKERQPFMTLSSLARPYGLWESPISPRSLAGALRLSDVQWDSDGQTLVWLEGRAKQGVLVQAVPASGEAPADLTTELSVRAQVGYGGGEFAVAGGHVFFVERSGRLYRQPLHSGTSRPITPEFGSAAAPAASPDGDWVMFVHSYENIDRIALVDAEGYQWPQWIVGGHDFYMQPCWHPDSTRIAYIGWSYPQMPWDGTTLYLATLQASHGGEGAPVVADVQVVAGSEEVAIFQPEFSPDGRWLSYVSDEDGWSHIFLLNLEDGSRRRFTHTDAEHGTPAWVQGMRTYGWSHDSQAIYMVRNERGIARLCRQRIDQHEAEPLGGLETYTWLSQPAISPTANAVALVGTASTQPPRLLLHESPPERMPTARVMQRSQAEVVPATKLAQAQPVSWPLDNGLEIHGMLYLPPGTTREELAAASVRPPALIKIHGGPTAQAVASYAGDVQFFATRGYVVLLVNYRGSTGYGKLYKEALRGGWGIVDVEDAVSGARFLREQGIADGRRIVIMGGSSGGYTVLEALCRAPGVFRAGLCFYGISNLFTLVDDTHKFEARYLDTLVGPLPEASDIYRERSPLFHAELIKDPVAIFQGTEDTIVPRNQSDAIVAALKRNGVPHEYHLYEGEGHGWRKPDTIEAFYNSVDAFLRQYVLFV